MMRLLQLTLRQGQNDRQPCFIDVGAIRAITISSDPSLPGCRIHIGEQHPIHVLEGHREVLDLMARSQGLAAMPGLVEEM